MQALIEYWSDGPGRRSGGRKRQSLPDSATARVRLHAIEGRAWSLLGDAREASRHGRRREAREPAEAVISRTMKSAGIRLCRHQESPLRGAATFIWARPTPP
jgi:hypothetical protein